MKTRFDTLIKDWFSKSAKFLYNKINGTKEEPKYLHTTMLDEEYSADMTYESVSGNFSRIAADVVEFDSPAPLKSRGALQRAKGDLPKIAMKFALSEKQMNTLGILMRMGGKGQELIKKIFNDSEACIFGIKERIELTFLRGFSEGITLVDDPENVGKGIRVDYNIPDANKAGVLKKWSDSAAKPLSDIKRMIRRAKAKGEYPKHIWMDSFTVDLLVMNDEIKQYFAFGKDLTSSNIPTLNEIQLTSLLKTHLKLTLHVIDRSVTLEKDGKRRVVDAWVKNMVVLTDSTKVGTLVYSTLAEEQFPVENVRYAKPNKYTLLSISGTTDPVSQKTAGQAMVIPVLQNVDSLFYIDTNEAEELQNADNPDEGGSDTDASITIWGTVLTKATVIAAYNDIADNELAADAIDQEVLDAINGFNAEEEELLKGELGVA